ncbi:MAG: hypothetical protein F6K19_37465 [Cyanothece sp. SIO1E1]|nr:hypothetical protein [Cyanothece sp. SIO1E1]
MGPLLNKREIDPEQTGDRVMDAVKASLVASIYARAHYLIGKGQQQGNPRTFLAEHRASVLSEIEGEETRLGIFNGEAEQFNFTTNRAAELASIATAIAWLENPALMKGTQAHSMGPLMEVSQDVSAK